MACEACRHNAAERVLSSATAGHAFELCLECTQRLSQFVLMPEQWLNVASVHTGHVLELHEDFYGLHGESRAMDPLEAWRVQDFAGDLHRLFDVVIAWNGELAFDEGYELIEKLRRFDPSQVKAELDARLVSAKYSNVCAALMNGAKCGILSDRDASKVARKLASSVGPDSLHEWVQLSMDRLPWPVIRDRFFEVVRALPPEARRFELVTLDHLARHVERARRKAVVAEFLRLLPPVDVLRSLAKYIDLVAAEDRPSLVTSLLADSVVSDQLVGAQDANEGSRSDAQYWAWGQIAAACDVDWSVHFFGSERGCWRVVCAAVEVALGRHADEVYPGVQAALRSEVGSDERWKHVEAELKSAGLWFES